MMQILITLAASIPPADLFFKAIEDADFEIAVDGGYKTYLAYGRNPDLLLGDFDSIDVALPENPSFKVLRQESQDITDLKKAFDYMEEHIYPSEITILGGTGFRTDHLINNLLIAADVFPEIPLRFISRKERIIRITGFCSVSEKVEPAQVISLVPITDCSGVTTSGLKWNLSNATMGVGKQLSQSNESISAKVDVEIISGALYMIMNHESKGES